jgi:uncharacterized membrane protein
MVSTVDEYLRLLRQELDGSDPAVIQDALADAEEHFRGALAQALTSSPGTSEPDAVPAIAEKYGSPQEVAAAYRQMEARLSPGLGRRPHTGHRSVFSRFFGVFADLRAWAALLYFLLSLATGIAYFTWAVTGISLSLGLLVLIVGLPLAALFLLSIRGIAFIEGRLVEALLGVRMPRRPRFSDDKAGLWQRIRNLFTQRTTWTALVYCLLQLGLGIFYFTAFATLIGMSLYFIALPLTVLAFDMPAYVVIGDTEYQAVTWALPFFVVLGVLLLTVTMHLARLMGRAHGALAKLMLVNDKA